MAQIRKTVTVSDISETSSGNAVSSVDKKSADLMFDNAVFGVSVTEYHDAGVSSWAVDVLSDVGGFNTIIAGVTGLGSTTSALIPISDPYGTTQHNFIGVPLPTSVNVIGSSTTAGGSTFSCIVTLTLHSNDRG